MPWLTSPGHARRVVPMLRHRPHLHCHAPPYPLRLPGVSSKPLCPPFSLPAFSLASMPANGRVRHGRWQSSAATARQRSPSLPHVCSAPRPPSPLLHVPVERCSRAASFAVAAMAVCRSRAPWPPSFFHSEHPSQHHHHLRVFA